MDKKKIIGNTLLFAGIMGYILLFGALFGQNNILIGVAAITAMLMLLERDLTIHPVANTVKFTGLNVLMGVAAFATGFSIWLAVPIHFIMMFIISYTLIFNLKNPLYFPFALQYLFLLAIPVDASGLPLRLLALFAGAVSIMALQLLANGKRMTKNSDPLIKTICASLLTKMDKKLDGESSPEIDEEIRKSISSLRSMIYDQREEDYYLTEEGRLHLNISAALEKIDTLLDSLEPRHEDGRVVSDVKQLLGRIANDEAKTIDAVSVSAESEQILESYRNVPPESSIQLRLLNNVDYLTDSLVALGELEPKKRKIARKIEEIPLKFKKLALSTAPNHVTSLKLSYAIRMATGIAIAGFLTDFFNLEEGRWMMFTVLSVIIPFYEQSHKKMRDRIFATIVGAVLVWIIFLIFTSNSARTGLLLLAGYLMSYVKVYRYSTILVTFTAIGSVAIITNETQFLTVERLLMVLAGIGIALLVNRFVLPYKQTDANRHLEEMSNDTLTEMISEAKDAVMGHAATGSHSMKNLLIISTMIEERARVNIQSAGKEAPDQLFAPRRLAANTMYELLMWKDLHGMSEGIAERTNGILEEMQDKWKNKEAFTTIVATLRSRLLEEPHLDNKVILSILLELATKFDQIVTELDKEKHLRQH